MTEITGVIDLVEQYRRFGLLAQTILQNYDNATNAALGVQFRLLLLEKPDMERFVKGGNMDQLRDELRAVAIQRDMTAKVLCELMQATSVTEARERVMHIVGLLELYGKHAATAQALRANDSSVVLKYEQETGERASTSAHQASQTLRLLVEEFATYGCDMSVVDTPVAPKPKITLINQ